MIDRNTKARAIRELMNASAEAVSDVANILSESVFDGDAVASVNQAVGTMMHAEAELTRVLDLIRAAKSLNQMNVAA